MHKKLTFLERLSIAREATHFFSPLAYEKVQPHTNQAKTPGKIGLFSVMDYVKYLEKSEVFAAASEYQFAIADVCSVLSRSGVLQLAEPSLMDITAKYSCVLIRSENKEYDIHGRKLHSLNWVAAGLGSEALFHFFSNFIVHITGKDKEGDVHAGTGVLIAKDRVLTCAHVLTDMALDEHVHVLGKGLKVIKSTPHKAIDVGVIEIEPAPTFEEGQVCFKDPDLLEEIFVMGYPRVPQSKEPQLLIQKGEINSPAAQTVFGDEVFLFSAVARPGNSGGPIISAYGSVVGIVSQDLFEKSEESKEKFILPFFAGIPAREIAKAIEELDLGLKLP